MFGINEMNFWLSVAFAAVVTLFAYLITKRSKLPQAPESKLTLYFWQSMFYPKNAQGLIALFIFMALLCHVLWYLFSSYMIEPLNMFIATGIGLVIVLMLFRLIVKKWLLRIKNN